jgi:hypothetical protein
MRSMASPTASSPIPALVMSASRRAQCTSGIWRSASPASRSRRPRPSTRSSGPRTATLLYPGWAPGGEGQGWPTWLAGQRAGGAGRPVPVRRRLLQVLGARRSERGHDAGRSGAAPPRAGAGRHLADRRAGPADVLQQRQQADPVARHRRLGDQLPRVRMYYERSPKPSAGRLAATNRWSSSSPPECSIARRLGGRQHATCSPAAKMGRGGRAPFRTGRARRDLSGQVTLGTALVPLSAHSAVSGRGHRSGWQLHLPGPRPA